jgi:hypothetical protein
MLVAVYWSTQCYSPEYKTQYPSLLPWKPQILEYTSFNIIYKVSYDGFHFLYAHN